MIIFMISNAVWLLFGLLYPAYASFLAVKNKDVRGYVQWMMYWIVFAIYSSVTSFTDTFLGPWFPFYYELKICFLLWLMAPQTGGAGFVYRRFLHPKLVKYEPEIDSFLFKIQSQTSSFIYQWANRLISAIIQTVSETVQKGVIRAAKHETLSQHLLRSLSLDAIQQIEPLYSSSSASHSGSRSAGVSPSRSDFETEEFLVAAGGMIISSNVPEDGVFVEESNGEVVTDEELRTMEVEEQDVPPKGPRTRRRQNEIDILNSASRAHDSRRKRGGRAKKERNQPDRFDFE